MNKLVDTLTSHVHDHYKKYSPVISSSVDFLVDLHLNSNHYAMPVISKDLNWYIQKLEQHDYDAISDSLVFEQTKTMRGIIRVMVRTHLNRQGVGLIVRGSQNKTLTPRVLAAFDDEFEYESLFSSDGFIALWQNMLEKRPELYDEIDRKSLCALSGLGEEVLLSSRLLQGCGLHNNWAKVLTGVYSGIRYLKQEYDFMPVKLWQEIDDCAGNYNNAEKLVKKFRGNVHQYGIALAGSFLADLGSKDFVKSDTHVLDCAAIILNREKVSDHEAVNLVYAISDNLKIPPRMVDKVFFLGCSGYFYLTGFKANHTRELKQNFLRKIASLDLLR